MELCSNCEKPSKYLYGPLGDLCEICVEIIGPVIDPQYIERGETDGKTYYIRPQEA